MYSPRSIYALVPLINRAQFPIPSLISPVPCLFPVLRSISNPWIFLFVYPEITSQICWFVLPIHPSIILSINPPTAVFMCHLLFLSLLVGTRETGPTEMSALLRKG